jgi:hypothetical protein
MSKIRDGSFTSFIQMDSLLVCELAFESSMWLFFKRVVFGKARRWSVCSRVLLPVASATKQQHVAERKVHEVDACKRKQN